MASARPKGLILAGEHGDALTSHEDVRVKQLLPVANEPLLFYGLETMRAAGIKEIGIVVTPDTQDAIREAVRDGSAWGVRVRYLRERVARGLVGSLLSAERFLDGSVCAAMLGDGLLRADLRPLLDEVHRDRLDALLLVQSAPVRTPNGLHERRLLRLVQPQDGARGSSRLAGVYLFGPRFVRAARAAGTAPSDAGLVQAVERLLDANGRIRTRALEGSWRRVADADELLEVNRRVLDELVPGYAGAELVDTHVQGRVAIDASATLEHTMVRGPAIIGAGAQLRHAYIGPYTAIGEGAVIEGAEIEHSIILSGASIKHLGTRLEGSVVGRRARVFRDFALPRAMRLRVADGDEISLA
jgi:glucose-1-phosphate thymidylyltransferase